MALLKQLVLISCVVAVLANKNGPLVNTPYGPVRGLFGQSYSGRPYSYFLSVPYAAAPVGEWRFREPIPHGPYWGEFQANTTTMCPQWLFGKFMGDEDCLNLNIYVPSTKPGYITDPLPVVVHIHGGAFMFGYGEDYTGPKFYMDKDVILVTINYRLGALGFLSTQDQVVPGNNGLKDQVFALKWIKRYIHHFGGDENQITITGMSAGGASVHYHYLSPLSKGLFKNGISFSGSAFDPWTMQEAPVEKAKKLADAIGCKTLNNKDMVKCMRTRNAKQIVETTKNVMYDWLENPFSPFAPVVEPTGGDPKKTFISEHPYKIISKGKAHDLPWVVTSTKDEGLYPSAGWLNDADKNLPELERNWNSICPHIFDFNYTLPIENHERACQYIKQYYLNNEAITYDNFHKVVKALSDRLFISTIEKAAKLQAKNSKSPVYTYVFNYRSETMPTFADLFSTAPRQGICHGDDMAMVYDLESHGITSIPSENDKYIQNVLFELYLSFGKTNIPSTSDGIVWYPVGNDGEYLQHLYIESPEVIEMRTEKYVGNEDFWDALNLKENENYYN